MSLSQVVRRQRSPGRAPPHLGGKFTPGLGRAGRRPRCAGQVPVERQRFGRPLSHAPSAPASECRGCRTAARDWGRHRCSPSPASGARPARSRFVPTPETPSGMDRTRVPRNQSARASCSSRRRSRSRPHRSRSARAASRRSCRNAGRPWQQEAPDCLCRSSGIEQRSAPPPPDQLVTAVVRSCSIGAPLNRTAAIPS